MRFTDCPTPIPDVQSSEDLRQMPIQKVGIRAIRHPIHFVDRGAAQPSVATFAMYVSLPAEQKGTHMSRFVDILNQHTAAVSVANFAELLQQMVSRLESSAGFIEMAFPYFMKKAAPISKVESLLDYDVRLIGEIHEEVPSIQLSVQVPVTSLCPCSKKISDYGAHNQRSHVTVTAGLKELVFVEELIELVEKQASCELYGLLKRPDEKYVTERAYDNPKFVEDMVRDIALALQRDDRVANFSVESENFESIHNHSAYAKIVG